MEQREQQLLARYYRVGFMIAGAGLLVATGSFTGERRRPDRGGAGAPGRVGAAGAGRDEPGPDEPGQGAGAGRRRAPRGQGAGPAHGEPPGVPQPGPPAGPHLPAGGGHPGRHPGRTAGSAPGGWWRPPSSRSWSSSCWARRCRRTGPCTIPSGPPCSAPPWCRPSCASGRCGWCRAPSSAWPTCSSARRASTSGPGVTESELLAMADVAVEGDVIETEERAFIHSIIEFGDTVVREVMVPRPDMVTIGADETVEVALERALEVGFSRVPAVELAGRRRGRDRLHQGHDPDGALRPRRRPGPGPSPRGPLRARDQAGLRPDARDAGRELPPGRGGQRVRRHGRAGHARGPHRGAGRGDRRRVRRRGGALRATGLGRAPGQRPATRRRGQRADPCRAPHRGLGHGRRAGVRPAGARPRSRGVGRGGRAAAGGRPGQRAPHRTGPDRAHRPSPTADTGE